MLTSPTTDIRQLHARQHLTSSHQPPHQPAEKRPDKFNTGAHQPYNIQAQATAHRLKTGMWMEDGSLMMEKALRHGHRTGYLLQW
jgi:hypothetical protein